jgi:hypothetical protein
MDPHEFEVFKAEMRRHARRVALQAVNDRERWDRLERWVKTGLKAWVEENFPAKAAGGKEWVERQIEARDAYVADLAKQLGLDPQEAIRRFGTRITR